MKFPNLIWAIARRRLAHYELAVAAELTETKFSKGLNGRVEFSPEERLRIAKVLGYEQDWLFQEIVPPAREADERQFAPAV